MNPRRVPPTHRIQYPGALEDLERLEEDID